MYVRLYVCMYGPNNICIFQKKICTIHVYTSIYIHICMSRVPVKTKTKQTANNGLA